MKVRFLNEARDELRGAVKYYNRQRPGLGGELRDEVRAAVSLIQQHPLAWHPLNELNRRCHTNRFPYGLIYTIYQDEIVIIAVAHLHREPEYWSDRI